MHVFDDLLDVGGEVERFREDDEVERAVELQILAGHDMEFCLGQFRAGGPDLIAGEIDPGEIPIREQGKKISGAASDFEDACSGRNEVSVINGQQFSVKAPARRWFCRRRVIECPQLIQVPLQEGGTKWNRQRWGTWRKGGVVGRENIVFAMLKRRISVGFHSGPTLASPANTGKPRRFAFFPLVQTPSTLERFNTATYQE